MNAETEPLADAAARLLTGLMATDVWTQARALMLRLWRRNRPDQARQVEADLGRSDREVGDARRCHAVDQEQAVREEWRARIAELLACGPRAESEMREAVKAMAHLQRYADSGLFAPAPVSTNHRDG